MSDAFDCRCSDDERVIYPPRDGALMGISHAVTGYRPPVRRPVALLWTTHCRRPAAGDAVPGDGRVAASATTSPSGVGGSRYTSAPAGFAVEFPFPGPPTVEELPVQETVIGRVRTTSHYVSRGDTAFDVQVARYPKGSQSKDLNGPLKVERVNALQQRGAHLVRERARTFTEA